VDFPGRTVLDADNLSKSIRRLDAITIEHSDLSEDIPLVERLHAAASYLRHLRDKNDEEGEP